MENLGIKTFWKNADGITSNQKDNQILKNDCYINIKLHCANYISHGTWWQRTFGGYDSIALITSLNYKAGDDLIEAITVQNRKKVKIEQSNNLAINKIIGEKIPSTADSLSMDVKMIALKNDKLQDKFDMLNKSEYQTALQLTPKSVGQIITITSLIKNLLTDSGPQYQIEASFAGIISSQKENEPISNGKLTKGVLIFIATDPNYPFENADVSKFNLKNYSLCYGDDEVKCTYAVFIISTDDLRGSDQNSSWFKKYTLARRNLDKIKQAKEQIEAEKIYKDSIDIWMVGNTLLGADVNYLEKEKTQIINAIMAELDEQYLINSQNIIQPAIFSYSNDILKGLTGGTAINSLKEALPATGSFLEQELNIDPTIPIDSEQLKNIYITRNQLFDFIGKDKKAYIDKLDKNNIKWIISL